MALAAEGQSSVIAGPYRASWNGLDLGQITPDGYELTWQNSSYAINSDMTGEGTITDQIYNGTTCQISFTLQHWNAYGVEKLLWWMGEAANITYKFGHIAGLGRRHFDSARPLILESCFFNGTLLSAANPDIDPLEITFGKTLLSNAKAVSFLLATKPRYIPVTLDVMPYTVGGTSGSEVLLRPTSCDGFRFWDCVRNPNQPSVPGNSAALSTATGVAPGNLDDVLFDTETYTPPV